MKISVYQEEKNTISVYGRIVLRQWREWILKKTITWYKESLRKTPIMVGSV